MSSGGSKSPSNTTNTQVTIPKYAEPYAMEMLGRNQALNQQGYQQYGGQRIAGFTPMQEQAFNNIYGMQPSPQTGAASGLAALAGLKAAGMEYTPTQGQNFYNAPQGMTGYQQVQAPELRNYQMGPADYVNSRNFNQRAADAYMSPYMQSVVDAQKREAIRDDRIAGTQRGFNAATSGAFGGSRQAIVDAEANRDLGTRLNDIQGKGLQDAFTQAQSQFNQDQVRRLQASLANQQAGLTVGQQNLNALLGVQQLGANNYMQAGLANQQAGLTDNAQTNAFNLQNAGANAQYGLAGAQLGEESKQFGFRSGLDAIAQMLASSGQLGSLGDSYYNQNMGISQAQLDSGGRQQGLEQQYYDTAYEDFINKNNYPYKQLGFSSDLLRGLPTNESRTVYGYPNTAAQATGTLGGLASLYMAGKKT